MTWQDLADEISEMSAQQRAEPVALVHDYHGPDRAVLYVELVEAWEDVWVGISAGNELMMEPGDYFLSSVEDDVQANIS